MPKWEYQTLEVTQDWNLPHTDLLIIRVNGQETTPKVTQLGFFRGEKREYPDLPLYLADVAHKVGRSLGYHHFGKGRGQ
jgi:hypothetical protein